MVCQMRMRNYTKSIKWNTVIKQYQRMREIIGLTKLTKNVLIIVHKPNIAINVLFSS